MATYVPNANQLTEPVESREVVTSAAEHRAIKAKLEAVETAVEEVDAAALQLVAGAYSAVEDIDMNGNDILDAGLVSAAELRLGGLLFTPADFDPDTDSAALLRGDLAAAGGAGLVGTTDGRTVQDLANTLVTVYPSGVTATDTANIQSALNAAASVSLEGGVVRLAPGDFSITQLVWPVGKFSQLIGAGSSAQGNGANHPGATTLNCVGSGTALLMRGTGWDVGNVGGLVSSLTLKGPGRTAQPASIGIDVQWASGSSGQFSLRDLYIYDFGKGVQLDAVLEVAFYEVCVRGCGVGWNLEPTVEAVNANHWYNCRIESSPICLRIYQAANQNVWHGGTIQGADTAVFITGSPTGGGYKNGFIGTWFEGNLAAPVTNGAEIFTIPGLPPVIGTFFHACIFTGWSTGVLLNGGTDTVIRECIFLNVFTGGRIPVAINAESRNTLLLNNHNWAGNNDYLFAGAGPGLVIDEMTSGNVRRIRYGSQGQTDVQTSGRSDFASNGEVLLLRNISTGTVYADATVSTVNPRIELINGMTLDGYAGNFTSPTFKLGRGIGFPQLTTADRNSLSTLGTLAAGDSIYNTTTNKFQGLTVGGVWVDFH